VLIEISGRRHIQFNSITNVI